jgi:hypothetical protein
MQSAPTERQRDSRGNDHHDESAEQQTMAATLISFGGPDQDAESPDGYTFRKISNPSYTRNTAVGKPVSQHCGDGAKDGDGKPPHSPRTRASVERPLANRGEEEGSKEEHMQMHSSRDNAHASRAQQGPDSERRDHTPDSDRTPESEPGFQQHVSESPTKAEMVSVRIPGSDSKAGATQFNSDGSEATVRKRTYSVVKYTTPAQGAVPPASATQPHKMGG